MKNYFFTAFFILILINQVISQNPLVKQWDYRFGGTNHESLHAFQQTTDEGYILGGYSNSGISGDKSQSNWDTTLSLFANDYWIVKTDSAGNKMWEKSFGGTKSDYLYALQQTNDGGYILGGFGNSDSTGDKTQPNWDTAQLDYDFWIVKTDSIGNKEWDKRFGGTITDALYSLQQTTDGGYILGGSSRSGITGDKTQPNWGSTSTSDYWIVKIDSLGNTLWDQRYGGTNDDVLLSLQQSVDGGYLLGGYSQSGISGNKTQPSWGSMDYWIIKTDSFGNQIWDRRFGGSNQDVLYSLQQTNDGGYILAGLSGSGISGDKTQAAWGSLDYWIVKIDALGNKQWDKDFGGSNPQDEFGNISQTADGGYLVSGTSYANISGDKTENNLGQEQSWIIKTDSSGNKQWDKTLFTSGHDEICYGVQAIDGCYTFAIFDNGGIAGYRTQPNWDTAGITYDYWIAKFCDTSSSAFPVVNIASSDTTFCGKQCLDFFDLSSNNPTSWQWFFPGADSTSSNMQNPTGICYNSFGSFDVTLIACNASGCDTLYLPNFIHEFQNPPVPIVTWIADTLFSTPSYSYQWYFNSNIIPGAIGQYYVFQQPGNYFVIVTDSNGCATSSNAIYTGINEMIDDNPGIYVIPNPTDGNFIIYGAPVNSDLKIYDVEGRIIFSDKIESTTEHLKLEASDGIYFVEITYNNRIVRKKIVLKK